MYKVSHYAQSRSTLSTPILKVVVQSLECIIWGNQNTHLSPLHTEHMEYYSEPCDTQIPLQNNLIYKSPEFWGSLVGFIFSFLFLHWSAIFAFMCLYILWRFWFNFITIHSIIDRFRLTDLQESKSPNHTHTPMCVLSCYNAFLSSQHTTLWSDIQTLKTYVILGMA